MVLHELDNHLQRAFDRLQGKEIPVDFPVVRVLPFQQISADVFSRETAFSWRDALTQGSVPIFDDYFYTHSFWTVKGKESNIHGQAILPGGYIPDSIVASDPASSDDMKKAAAEKFVTKIHDFSTTSRDINFFGKREYVIPHKNGKRHHIEFMATAEVSPNLVPLSVNPSDKIDRIVGLNPLQLRKLFSDGVIHLSDGSSVQLLDSLRGDTNTMEQILAQAEAYEAEMRRNILLSLFQESTHQRYGKDSDSGYKKTTMATLSRMNFSSETQRTALLGKYDASTKKYGSGLYASVISTFMNHSQPFSDPTQELQFKLKFAAEDRIQGKTDTSPKRVEFYDKIAQRYRIGKDIAQAIRRVNLRHNIIAISDSGTQEPILTAEFLPSLGYFSSEEWNIFTHREAQYIGESPSHREELNHNLIKLYKAIYAAFNIVPTEPGCGKKLLNALEDVRRLRANQSRISPEQHASLMAVVLSLENHFERETGIDRDSFSYLSIDINNFKRNIQNDTLTFITGNPGFAAEFNQGEESEVTRILDLVLMMHGMLPSRARMPDGSENPDISPLSAERRQKGLAWASVSKLLLMMGLADSDKRWMDKMRKSTERFDEAIEVLRAKDDEGKVGEKFYYHVYEKNSPNPIIRFYPVKDMPNGIEPEGVVTRFKLNFTVDNKPVYIILREREKDRVQRYRKELTLDPKSGEIEDEFAEMVLIWTQLPQLPFGIEKVLFSKQIEDWRNKVILEFERQLEYTVTTKLGYSYDTERRKPQKGIHTKPTPGRDAASERLARLKYYLKIADGPKQEIQIDGADYFAWRVIHDPPYYRERLATVRPGIGKRPLLGLLFPRGRAVSEDLYLRIVTRPTSRTVGT